MSLMVTFLLVEDDPDHMELIERELRERLPHVEFRWTCDGNEVEALAAELRPSAILLDIDLGPQSPDGWAINAALKRHPELCRIPVLAVTAHAYGGEDADRATREGFAGHFSKPVVWDRLAAHLRRYCSPPESSP
jgi:two-component system cell cycle response regulator DivK